MCCVPLKLRCIVVDFHLLVPLTQCSKLAQKGIVALFPVNQKWKLADSYEQFILVLSLPATTCTALMLTGNEGEKEPREARLNQNIACKVLQDQQQTVLQGRLLGVLACAG